VISTASSRAVSSSRAAFGVRFDPVGERISLVDENGAVISDDRALLVMLDLVAAERAVGRVALPVGGMMSAAPFEETADALQRAHAATHALGCHIPSPYIILSFVGLYVVPDLGLTELGLIDTASQSFVDVLLPGAVDRCGS
jgi:adenine deaminase